MDVWEQQMKNKMMVTKIKNAKSTLKSAKKPRDTKNLQNDSDATINSKISGLSQNENQNKESIPLYKLLKMYQLQQYANSFISKGYGYDLTKFASIDEQMLESLQYEFKMAPGHKTKFVKLIEFVNSILPCLNEYSSMSTGKSKKLSENLNSKSRTTFSNNTAQEKRNFNKQNTKFSSPLIPPLSNKSKPVTSKVIEPQRNFYKKEIPQKPTQKIEQKQFKQSQQSANQQNKKLKIKNIGIDYFRDSDDFDIEFDKTLKQIMLKYDNEAKQSFMQESIEIKKMKEKPQNKIEMIQPKASQNQQKMSITQKIDHSISDQISQTQSAKDVIKSTQIKHTIKPSSFKSQDDQNLIEKFTENDKLELCFKPSTLNHIFQKQLSKKSKSNQQNANDEYPNLNIETIKQMYQSYDSAKLTSTLVNLDIEEITFCLAQAIHKHLENSAQIKQVQQLQQWQASGNNQIQKKSKLISQVYSSMQDMSKGGINPMEEPTIIEHNQVQDSNMLYQSIQNHDKYKLTEEDYYLSQNEDEEMKYYEEQRKEKNSLGAISEKTLEHSQGHYNSIPKSNSNQFEVSRNQVEEILKESLILKAKYEDYDNNENEGFDDYQEMEQPELQNLNQVPPGFYESQFEEVDVDYEEDTNLKAQFDRCYLEEQLEYCQCIPSVDVIKDFCKNIIITCKMEKEVTIISLIYLERLLIASTFQIDSTNWRKIIFTSLILASKIWDDESFENGNFAKAFPTYTTKQINEFEKVYLNFINYNLYVKSSDYAKYYFVLRTYAEKHKKSFPLRPLDVKTILALQKSSNRAESSIKEYYMSTMNRSF